MTLHATDPVRRALTETELTAILVRVDNADSTGNLLAAVVNSVYDTLLPDSGLTLIFHGATRCCTAGDGCTATIADDGTAHPLWSTAVLADHAHQPSFPLDAPQPGSWSLHS